VILHSDSCDLELVPVSPSRVRHSVFIRSAIAWLQDVIQSQVIVVIGGVGVVSRLWVILRLPCAPRIDRGRSR
jgi:hypothetical protein